jgi:hypothetical protein
VVGFIVAAWEIGAHENDSRHLRGLKVVPVEGLFFYRIRVLVRPIKDKNVFFSD